jgi:hypothetical protein
MQFLERLFRGAEPMAAAGAVKADSMKSDNADEPRAPLRRMMERGMASYAFDAQGWARSLDPARMDALVLAAPAVNPPAEGLDVAERVRALVSDAAYQLK